MCYQRRKQSFVFHNFCSKMNWLADKRSALLVPPKKQDNWSSIKSERIQRDNQPKVFFFVIVANSFHNNSKIKLTSKNLQINTRLLEQRSKEVLIQMCLHFANLCSTCKKRAGAQIWEFPFCKKRAKNSALQFCLDSD